MPGRKVPLVAGEIYHVFNRGISHQPTFFDKRDYKRFFDTIVYYRNCTPPMKLSLFLTSSTDNRNKFIEKCQLKADFLVEIICYCLMPNHFHLLLKQLTENGISYFMSNLCNSYTRYLNTRQKRIGPIFQGKFNAVRIENDSQLLHVSRYIHLNPLTSFVVKNETDLENYPYSSFPEYISKKKEGICQKEIVLDQYKSTNAYQKFTLDQADYQKKLERIKHLILEKE